MTALTISYQDLIDSHRQLVKKVRELRQVREQQAAEIAFLRETLALYGIEIILKKPN